MRKNPESCVRLKIFFTECLGSNARRKISLDDGLDRLLTGAVFEQFSPNR